ncbi:MAG TPA: Xaa-Pro aminopeptidase [Gemmatimonadaceae bacterium]|nr:Xaa-Pro aminopeptidase [Gemmatimonadaceae bacterium]
MLPTSLGRLRLVAALALFLVAAPLSLPLHAQITAAEYAARRDSLAARLDSGIVVAYGGRNPVTDFGTFFQLPGFRYLTGYLEPDAALIIFVRDGQPRSTLFVTPADPRRAFYYGFRPDSATIARELGLDSRPFDSFGTVLDSLVTADSALSVYELPDVEDQDFARQDSLTRGQQWMKAFWEGHPGLEMRDATPVVDQLRARKSPAEMALLRRAAEISAEGHRAVLTAPEPSHEYEWAAVLEYTFKRLGAARPAYGSIVGAGVNGTQLHYMKDDAPARPGDLVVMDAAAEYEGYAADITRTIPVSGTFTPEQRAIYQLVRDAQAAAERQVRPGGSAQASLDSSIAVRARGLAKLGLIDSANAMIDPPWRADCNRTPAQCTQANLWMIHGISHGLGLAVHDPAQFYEGDRTYQPGDVFTIEPGIYISTRSLDALPDTPRNRAWIARVRPLVKKYENTGVRIEDDYIVTESGVERISSKAPREIDEIEAIMKQRPKPVIP